MKPLITVLGLLSFTCTVFAAKPTCPKIRELLISSKTQLEMNIGKSRMAQYKSQIAKSNLSLQKLIKSTESAINLVKDFGCIDMLKAEDRVMHEKYIQLQELSNELQASENPTVMRAIVLHTDALYLIELLK